jgi:hypothetical protein
MERQKSLVFQRGLTDTSSASQNRTANAAGSYTHSGNDLEVKLVSYETPTGSVVQIARDFG